MHAPLAPGTLPAAQYQRDTAEHGHGAKYQTQRQRFVQQQAATERGKNRHAQLHRCRLKRCKITHDDVPNRVTDA